MITDPIELKPRIGHPAAIFSNLLPTLLTLGKIAHDPAVPLRTLMLVELRASQINGCSVCVDMHARDLKKHGDTDERIFGVAAWRDNPAFDEAERAALALAEALTRIGDREDPVSDEVWSKAARHYEEKGLATLVLAIANINLWNRLNVGVRQTVGAWNA